MTGNEVLAVEAMLYDILNDSPSNIPVFSGIAPDDAEPPFYLFAMQTADDTLGVGDPASRVLTTFRYVVRAFGWGPSYAGVRDMADFIDVELHNADGTTLDGRRMRVRRLSPIADREPNDGNWMVSLGGVYEVVMGGLDVASLDGYGATYDEANA